MSKFEIYQATDGERWRLKDNNHQIIATGGESFANAEYTIRNILEEVNSDTPIVSDGSSKDSSENTRFAYYVGKDNQYYWRLQNKGNNKIIGIGNEGFSSESNVVRSIENVRGEIIKIEIEIVHGSVIKRISTQINDGGLGEDSDGKKGNHESRKSNTLMKFILGFGIIKFIVSIFE